MVRKVKIKKPGSKDKDSGKKPAPKRTRKPAAEKPEAVEPAQARPSTAPKEFTILRRAAKQAVKDENAEGASALRAFLSGLSTTAGLLTGAEAGKSWIATKKEWTAVTKAIPSLKAEFQLKGSAIESTMLGIVGARKEAAKGSSIIAKGTSSIQLPEAKKRGRKGKKS